MLNKAVLLCTSGKTGNFLCTVMVRVGSYSQSSLIAYGYGYSMFGSAGVIGEATGSSACQATSESEPNFIDAVYDVSKDGQSYVVVRIENADFDTNVRIKAKNETTGDAATLSTEDGVAWSSESETLFANATEGQLCYVTLYGI